MLAMEDAVEAGLIACCQNNGSGLGRIGTLAEKKSMAVRGSILLLP